MPLAPSPFNQESADTVLRSSDGVDFRVRSAILIEASTFFKYLVGPPQTGSDSSCLGPIAMAEDSRTLQILLLSCYPLVERVPADLQLEEARAVLEAAVKYGIDTAKELMRRALTTFADTQPLRVYAIACICKLEPEARHAAAQAVAKGVVFGHYVKELEEITAACYHRLVQFQNQPTHDANFTFSSAAADPSTAYGTELESELSEKGWRNAPSPFDSPDADVIIRSRDRVHFRVHSAILKLASLIFSDMLAHPNLYPCQSFERDAEIQGVSHYWVLPESSTVLERILGSCYFLQPQVIAQGDHLMQRSVMDAALKYSLQHVLQTLKIILLDAVSSNPLQTFILASFYGWELEARGAAVASLQLNSMELQSTYDPILEQMSGGPYFWLLDYHRRCCIAASNAIQLQTQEWKGRYCQWCDVRSVVSARLQSYMDAAKLSLMKTPHPRILSEGNVHLEFTLLSAIGCQHCQVIRAKYVHAFSSVMKAKVSNATSQVKIGLAP